MSFLSTLHFLHLLLQLLALFHLFQVHVTLQHYLVLNLRREVKLRLLRLGL